MDDGSNDEAPSREHRYMVEDITVTPFLERHGDHMPATIKLHAEVREESDSVILETSISGYDKDDVDVSATANTIEVTLVVGRDESGEVKFHNSYFTPVPIDEKNIKVEYMKDKMRVTASKR